MFHSNSTSNFCQKNWLQFPFEITDVEENLNKQLIKDFTGEQTGFVQVGSNKWFFPSGFKKNAIFYYNFKPRSDDIWIVTFPRSGTTWTQELVWLLTNNLNYQEAANIPLEVRFPFLEFSSFLHPIIEKELLIENQNSTENCNIINNLAVPGWLKLTMTTKQRFIKTHLPFELLPPNLLDIGAKVIYVARNPKDVAVSYYHLNRTFRTQGFSGSFEKYWYYFKNNLQPWTPYWNHILNGWKKRTESNMLFMFYEDMINNLPDSIDKIASFLNVDYSKDEYKILENHLNFNNFRNNPSVNAEYLRDVGITLKEESGFVRNGKNKNWKDYFAGNLNDEADQWIRKNLKETDIKFPD